MKNQVVKGVAMSWSLFTVGFVILILIVIMVCLMIMSTVSCLRVPEYSLMMMMRYQVVSQES